MKRHHNFSKNAQIEMIGLMIVLVLVSIGVLFFIQFSLTSGAAPRQVFTSGEIAKNTLNTLLRTSVPCPTLDAGVDITSLVQDCAAVRELDCNRDGIADACKLMIDGSATVMNATLQTWAKNYQLQFVSGDLVLGTVEQGTCPRSKSSGVYYVPPKHFGVDKVFVKLDVCERN